MRRVVGYCPQHDALEGLLSARETLRMYAAHQARAP
jgi:ATP-binding cassette subfamily A (ABC1) protein 7